MLNDVNNIFSENFPWEETVIETFHYQYQFCEIYHRWCNYLGKNPSNISNWMDIPFLPIQFFKTHKVITNNNNLESSLIFESSGTTGQLTSRHYVLQPSIYEASFSKGFESVYGKPEDWVIMGLLPSYLERSHSSLVYMVDYLIKQSGRSENGFYLYEAQKMLQQIDTCLNDGKKVWLIGVTYALLDAAEQFKSNWNNNLVVVETGGMKGRKREMIRAEVHATLQNAWNLPTVHAEYGMTELLSQAYSKGYGIFECPPWMKVLVREEDQPLAVHKEGRGVLNVIDLANRYSCSFIATDDMGTLQSSGQFTVEGRLDVSDIRGCSLMWA